MTDPDAADRAVDEAHHLRDAEAAGWPGGFDPVAVGQQWRAVLDALAAAVDVYPKELQPALRRGYLRAIDYPARLVPSVLPVPEEWRASDG